MKKFIYAFLLASILMGTTSASAITPLPDQGVYRIQNGKKVVF